MATTRRPKRTRLSRDRVLRAAVALADDDGIAAVSMRAVAERLGVVPMALYKHVADKEDLLDGMVDVVLADIDPPVEGVGWRDGVRRRVLSARSALLRHPWAPEVIGSRTNRTPTVLAYMDSLAGQLLDGGFSADLTHHVMHALGNRMWGFSPELFNPPATPTTTRRAPAAAPTARRRAPDVGPERGATPADEPGDPPPDGAGLAAAYPHIARIAEAAVEADPDRAGCDEQFEFEFALDLLLDGFERLRDSGWTSAVR